MPDKNGLLTEAAIGAILAETGFPDEEVSYKHKAGVVSTINVYPLLREAIRVYHDHLVGMSEKDMLLTDDEQLAIIIQPITVSDRTNMMCKTQLAKAIPILRAKWEKEHA